MNTIIALIMGLVIAMGGATDSTEYINANAGTKTVVTTTITGEEYVEKYEFNYQTYEWELIEEA